MFRGRWSAQPETFRSQIHVVSSNSMELGSVLAIGIHRIVKEKLRAFGARSLMWCVYHGPSIGWDRRWSVNQRARWKRQQEVKSTH